MYSASDEEKKLKGFLQKLIGIRIGNLIKEDALVRGIEFNSHNDPELHDREKAQISVILNKLSTGIQVAAGGMQRDETTTITATLDSPLAVHNLYKQLQNAYPRVHAKFISELGDGHGKGGGNDGRGGDPTGRGGRGGRR